MVAVLLKLTGTEDPQLLATQQFKAKSSELAFMTPHALCNGDQKCFNFKTETFEGSVGFAVIETTDDDVIMSRSAEILAALAEDKKDKKLNVLFLSVVNIVKLRSNLLMIGADERSLAAAAFKNGEFVANGSGGEPYVMDLGGLVSRKKDYIPVVTAAIKNGWASVTV
jgi:inorganic pyrophosphatase/exopolyphosphatase